MQLFFLKYKLLCVIICPYLYFGEKIMSEKKTKPAAEKKEKMPKPAEKFIWLGISVIVAAAGYFLRKSGTELHWIAEAVYSALLLFTVIMSAQRTSVERFSAMPDKETGNEGNKKKYILSSILYYLIIILAVFYIFCCFWVSRVLSI